MLIRTKGDLFLIFGSTFIAFCYLCLKTNGRLANIAYLTIRDAEGEEAVDGDLDSCFELITQTEPVWRVNLEDYFIIQHIRVYGCMNECNNVVATVSMDNATFKMFDATPEVINNTYHKFEPLTPIGGRWVKLSMVLPGDMTFCEVEIMVKEREPFYMKSRPDTINDGLAILTKTIPVVSHQQCAYLCMRNNMCNGVNVILGMTSSAEFECQLLGPEYFHLDQDVGTTYWETVFE